VHASRLVIVAGTGIGAISLLLPFLTAPLLGTVDGAGAAAGVAVVLLLVPAAAALFGDRHEGFGLVAAVVTGVCAATATIFAAAKVVDALAAARDVRDAGVTAQVGAGPWTLLAGCAIVLVGIIASLSRRVG
jgi:Na+/melibiose symporter-like transporter